MKTSPRLVLTLALAMSLLFSQATLAQRQMENLGRGVVAMRKSSTQVYVGWRLLGNDPSDIAFNLYRSANGGAGVKLNTSPLTTTTDYTDAPGSTNLASYSYSYYVVPLINGVEQTASVAFTLPAASPTRQYLALPLQPVIGGANPPYDVKFCWVGDLDGDGEFDYVVDRLSTTGGVNQYLQAYKRDGTLLWQMDMGPNSMNQYSYEPGASAISIGDTDNVTVFDMDGDGRAEVLVRTANGVVVTSGTTTTQVAAITAGDNTTQFVSVIDGLTGTEKARATLPNPWAVHGTLTNKCAIAYFDGQRPSVLFYGYNRANSGAFYRVFTAFDYRNGALTQRWSLPQDQSVMPGAEGHQIRIADVDNDGKDEVCDIGHVIDDNGTQLFYTELTHGDRFHITDIDPDRPGLETYAIQQNNPTMLATALYESGNGKMIKKWYSSSITDVGRGIALDINPSYKGCEMYSTQPGIYNAKGVQIYTNTVWAPEGLWWDGDLGREFIDGAGSGALSPVVNKFNAAGGYTDRVFSIYNDNGSYSTHQAYGGRPAFWGDLFGDWREEIVLIASDYTHLRIYSTTTPATNRLYTLMHNPQYRCQATTKGYVQASYVDYYLGWGMTTPPPPPMVDAKLVWRGGAGATTWDAGVTQSWLDNGTNSAFANGDTVRFDIGGDNSTTVELNGALAPGAVTVYNPKPYVFDGTAGSLTGAMKLTKAGAGTLTLGGTHSFTGATTVWDGALFVSGDLQQSPVTVWGGIWGGALAAGKTGGRIGGTGRFSQPVTLQYRGAITPGNGINSTGTTSFGAGLTATDGSSFALDLSDDPTGTTKANDRIAVTGNLNLSGTVAIVVNALNAKLSAGNYTLLTYTGTMSGGAGNLAVTVPAGTPYTVSTAGGAIVLNVPATRAPASLVWTGGVSGNLWDLYTTPNWFRNSVADKFVAGDAVTFDDSGSLNPTVTLVTGLPVSGVTVNAASDYTFAGSGSISGTGGLTKSGSGTLQVLTTNDYTGPTIVNGGTLAVDNLNDGGLPSSIGAASTSSTNLVINGGTLSLAGPQTNTNRSLTLGTGGATIDVPSTSASLQISGTLSGSSLVKTGSGTLIFAKGNTYSGGTTINGGSIVLASSTANVSGLGTGPVTINNGTLSMSDVEASETAAWNVLVPAGATARIVADGRCYLTGALTGDGDLTFYTPYVRTELKGNWSAFTGRIFVQSDGGDFRVNNSYGYANAEVNLGPSVHGYSLSGGTLNIGALSGTSGFATISINSGASGVQTTWQVGALGTDTTFAGAISETVALTKTGTGSFTLTGSSSYTGATNVNQGGLVVNGILGATTVTVKSGAKLGGGGIIGGPVVVQSGGSLGTGNGTPGTLQFAGGLSMSGSGTLRMNLSNSTTSGGGVNDLFQITGGTLSMSGTWRIVPTYLDGSLVSGTYTLISGTAPLTGNPTFVWGGITGETATFDTSETGVVKAIVTAPSRQPGIVIWSGSNGTAWDYSTKNWKFGSIVDKFMSTDDVVFDDTMVSGTANITSSVDPKSLLVSNNTKPLTISGTLGGIISSGTLTKTGTGTLVMTGSNSFTGGVVINNGVLAITNTYALGTGTSTLSGGTLDIGSLNLPNVLNVSGTGVVRGGNGGGSANINTVTGAGDVEVQITAGVMDMEGSLAAHTGTISLTNAGGTYLRMNNNITGGPATYQIGAGVVFQKRSGTAVPVINLGGLAGAASATVSGATGSGNNSATEYVIGANHRDTTFAGFISNGTGTVAITKTGTGTLLLTGGSSTYTGVTTINSGALGVSVLANGGAVSSTGTSSNAAASLVINGGALQYRGYGATTDRRFTLGTNGGTLDASGLFAIVFSNTNALTFAGSNTARVLNLAGSNPGDNTLAASIGNNGSGSTSILKIGSGKWILSGNSSYTGTTTVAEGVLKITGSMSSASSIMVLNGATLDLGTALSVGSVQIDEGGNLIGATRINNGFSNDGTLLLSSGTLTLNGGSLVNTGTMRLSGNAALAVVSGTFVNNGVFDMMTSTGKLPANFINNGILLDASAVKIKQIDRAGNDILLRIRSYPGHNYQLQRRSTLTSGTWENVGSAYPGNGDEFLFTDPDAAAATRLFYRFLVSP